MYVFMYIVDNLISSLYFCRLNAHKPVFKYLCVHVSMCVYMYVHIQISTYLSCP